MERQLSVCMDESEERKEKGRREEGARERGNKRKRGDIR